MTNTDVLTRLRDMHQELAAINDNQSSGHKVDDQTVEALGQLVTDIGVIFNHIQEKKETPDADASEGNDLRDRIVSIEADHPRVSQFLNQFTDLLAMMGF